jgi:hypothetical protein
MNIRNKQCKACPWRVGVKPEEDIPGGYCETKHKNLKSTVAEPGRIPFGPMRMMACHESPVGNEQPCVGWTLHQLNEGNNIGLRMLAMDGRFKDMRTDGPQHRRFEDTLPKKKRRVKVVP